MKIFYFLKRIILSFIQDCMAINKWKIEQIKKQHDAEVETLKNLRRLYTAANVESFRAAITAAEDIIRSEPQIEFEVIHHFSPGIYARELRIPAGVMLTGKIHKTKHLCIMSGDIEVMSEDGGGRFTGYHTFLSKPGVKRIGYAHADTVFTTIHATDETDVAKLEAMLVVETYEQYETFLLESTKQIEINP